MPLFDRRCDKCEGVILDCLEPFKAPDFECAVCGGAMQRVWLPGRPNAVVGDEIDIEIKHGLCNPDGSPRRFRSREELGRAERAAGLVNYVTSEKTPGPPKNRVSVSFRR